MECRGSSRFFANLKIHESFGTYYSDRGPATFPRVRSVDADRLVQDVGRRLAELREARGLTQQALADALNVSMRYVQAVEAGEENLTLRSIAVLINVLRAPVTAVFEPPQARRRRPGRPRKPRP